MLYILFIFVGLTIEHFYGEKNVDSKCTAMNSSNEQLDEEEDMLSAIKRRRKAAEERKRKEEEERLRFLSILERSLEIVSFKTCCL